MAVCAGDLFLSNRLNYGMRGESVPKMIDSLRSVLQYPVETLFCGHSGVVSDGRSALEKKLRFLEWLQEETCRLADRGLTPREISRRLLAGGKVMEWVTLGGVLLGSSDSLDYAGEGMTPIPDVTHSTAGRSPGGSSRAVRFRRRCRPDCPPGRSGRKRDGGDAVGVVGFSAVIL